MQGPDFYRGSHGKKYEPPSNIGGFTVIPVLEFLWGMKWGELPLHFIRAVNPSWIRVTRDEIKCDAIGQRVTGWVNKNDKIERIEQEVQITGGTGYEMGQRLREAGVSIRDW